MRTSWLTRNSTSTVASKLAGVSRSGQLAENLVVFWKTVDSMFAEDHVAIDDDVENPAGPLDERGVDITVIFDCGGQTGRLGFIVSLHAVGDGDFHIIRTPRCEFDLFCVESRG